MVKKTWKSLRAPWAQGTYGGRVHDRVDRQRYHGISLNHAKPLKPIEKQKKSCIYQSLANGPPRGGIIVATGFFSPVESQIAMALSDGHSGSS
jgi:hypothetical protein